MARRHKKIVWTKQGYSTLDEAVGYAGQHSLTAAQDLLESALDTADSLSIFSERGRIDPEVHTLVWPNGADFDPATLHDWPDQVQALRERAQQWQAIRT